MICHGPLGCRRCWPNDQSTSQDRGPFRLINDPGHWGSAIPEVLVLGISKGNTQARAMAAEPFEQVAFKGIRQRLLNVLQSVGLVTSDNPATFDARFSASERQLAFASVVRCSLTGLNPKKGIHTAESPVVLPAFMQGSEAYEAVRACAMKFLADLPTRTSTVILLGNSDSYMEAMRKLISDIRGPIVRRNSVSFDSKNVRFVHVAHPSKGNGHFSAFITGQGTPGTKRNEARKALSDLR